MAINFQIPKGSEPKNTQTLVSGFGLPLVERAIINANIATQPSDPSTESLYGTPIFDDIFIIKPEYSVRGYDSFLNKYVTTPIKLAENKTKGSVLGFYTAGCIIDVTLANNIVSTQVSGYNMGTVKEWINTNDYNISIRGFVSTKYPDKYPLSDSQILATYCKAPVSLKIESQILNNVFGIEQIAVMSLNMFQQQGLRNVQYFELSAVSDFPFKIVKNA